MSDNPETPVIDNSDLEAWYACAVAKGLIDPEPDEQPAPIDDVDAQLAGYFDDEMDGG